ncbi:MAG: UTP--glucose-1-phosphate uridylyltransferase [Planctomycetota bacterium]
MKSLKSEDLQYLERYGFDSERFENWRRALRKGELSARQNKVTGKLLAPGPEQIHALPKSDSDEREELRIVGREAVRSGELGLVILNGGMATRFGGVVKGIVEVMDGCSFLGLKLRDVQTLERVCGGKIPVYLMNSFATEEATRKHLEKKKYFGLDPEQVRQFNQFISVRMTPDGDIFETDAGEISPYGPGHGDFAGALRASGCLDHFREQGGKYLLLANVDNLGARLSPGILGHHMLQKAEVTIEVAPKWPGDVGGSPFMYEGKLQLIEQIRFLEDFDPDIVDVFNTNTFHFTADALDRDFDLGWYYVEKTVEGRQAVQMEHLVGEMSRFLKSNFLRVKRTGNQNRFLPIKTPEDLDAGRGEIAEFLNPDQPV